MARGMALAAMLLLGFEALARDMSEASPTAKVVMMMNDLRAKSLQEKRDEALAMTTFRGWCKNTDKSKVASIEKASTRIEQLTADIEKYDAEAAAMGEEIVKLNGLIDTATADKEAAAKQNEEEKAVYARTHEDLAASVGEINEGKSTIKTMMQQTNAATAAALIQKIVSTKHYIPTNGKSALAAFLSTAHRQAEAEAVHGDPGAGPNRMATSAPEAHAFSSQSGIILDMMHTLQDKLKDELNQCEMEESNRVGAFNMVTQSLVNEIAANKDALARRTETKKAREADSGEANGDLSQTTTTKNEDEKYLSDLRAECTQKENDFKARQQVRKEELEALDKAIEIINSPDVAGAAEKHLPTLLEKKGSFAQLRSVASRPQQLQAAAYLQMQGEKFGSKMLSALAVAVSSDAFGKVKKMIKDMIMKLHEEANNEADHKAWCDTELGTNKQTREQKSSDVDELTAMVEENTAKMQQLQEEVERLMGDVAELDATMQKATEIRRSEKAKNTAVVQDAKVAVPAVERAMQVLKDFYDKASQATSFVQQGSDDPTKKSGPAGDAPETFGSTPFKGSSDSGGIIGMLEVIISDFQRLIAETEEEEAMGLKEYEKLMAESTKDKAVKETNIDHKKTQNTDLQVKTQEAKKDLTSAHEELAAAMEYFERLKPSCVDEGINYEEKVARRKEEIQSLKEALQILG